MCVHAHVCVYTCDSARLLSSFLRSLFFLSFRTQEQEGHTQQRRKQETSTLKLKNKNMKTERIFCIFLCSLFPLNFPENIHTLSACDWEWRCLNLCAMNPVWFKQFHCCKLTDCFGEYFFSGSHFRSISSWVPRGSSGSVTGVMFTSSWRKVCKEQLAGLDKGQFELSYRW